MSSDYSDDFSAARDLAVDGEGRSLRELTRGLVPRYGVAWRDVALGYVALAGGIVAAAEVTWAWEPIALLAAVALAGWFGWFLQYIFLFFHEAAHYLLAPSRPTNDLLTNVFIGVPFGQDIRAYRPIHMAHHRTLGTPEDSEHSYFDALTPGFLLRLATGVHTITILLDRDDRGRRGEGERYFNWVSMAGALFHLGLVGGAAALGHWMVAVSWTLGFLFAFPFFGALRQLIEHRDPAAGVRDLSREGWPAFTRMFRPGPIGSTFGAAGFNRHLLHHWLPQVSYTRLAEVERLAESTGLAPVIRERRTTYAAAFFDLLRAGRRT